MAGANCGGRTSARRLVGIMGADNVAVIDLANGTVQRRVHTGKGAHVIFVPHDGKVIDATNRFHGSVVAFDPIR